MDTHRLIAEIRNRPGLWNLHSPQYKDRIYINRLWNQVGRNVGADVDYCKRKWRNLRDAYRAEVRRSERRMERDRLMGITYDKNNYKSKWVYFDELEFMRGYKRRSCFDDYYENANSNSNDYDDDYAEPDNDSNDALSQGSIEIKMEPNDYQIDDDDDKHHEFVEDNDEMANEMAFEEFDNTKIKPEKVKEKPGSPDHSVKIHKTSAASENLETRPSSVTVNNIQCRKSLEKPAHFPENIGQKDQELVTSTKQEKIYSQNLGQIGDADFNFLVSFLPHMKKMNTLQNLQFRAKMSEMILKTFEQKTNAGHTT